MVYFVTAINTNSGKTLVSAILTKALQADYWKPVQTGSEIDKEVVRSLIDNNHCLIHDEAYKFSAPISPHSASKLEGVEIKLKNIKLPAGNYSTLIIEGAGGILVPLNEKEFVIDIAKKFKAEIIVVSNSYLGSINHTLLTINELKRRKLKIKGIIFNGQISEETEHLILEQSAVKCLLKLSPEKEITEEIVNKYAIKLFENWDD